MKIRVQNEYDSVRQIDLHLKSIDRRFRCLIQPEPGASFDLFTKEPNEMKIVFNDTNEIDNLIQVLERFKDECFYTMGKWRRV